MKNRLRLIVVYLSFLLTHSAVAVPHIVIDFETGNVLSHQQPFDPWHPASLTKLMTAYSVFKAIQAGELTGDSPVRVSKNARRQPPSRMGYRVGTLLSMENALKLLIVKSANDIAVAIAETTSGSVEGFAQRMNRDAVALGMNNSKFINPHGLHDRRQVTTARDMALLVRAIHREFPQYKSWFETPSVLAPSRTKNGKTIERIYYSYNLLLERYRGADGFKTGFVCASGYNFIGAATRSGRRIAAVILGRGSQTSRAVDAAKLMTEGFGLPNAAGVPIASFKPAGPVPSGPRNMRNILCTQEARAARYEPGAGQAVIKSPWLQQRQISRSPVKVSLLSGTAAQLAGARIPLPKFRGNTSIKALEPIGPAKATPPALESAGDATSQPKKSVALPNFRPVTQ